MTRPCPTCGEKKNFKRHTGPPRISLMCKSCGRIFVLNPKPKKVITGAQCICGETKDIHPYSTVPRVRLRCGQCGRTFRANPVTKQPKPVDASISAIYKTLGVKQ